METLFTTGLIISAVTAPVFFCAGLCCGFGIAQNVFVHRQPAKEYIPGKRAVSAVKRKNADEKPQETDEERLARLLAENVENFGTNVPQKEVV